MAQQPARYIIHADLDAFYAAVEQLDRPELRGKPVLVGGRPDGRGVVATASYEARKFGVHSAMPMATAIRQCPDGIVVRPRFDRYREMSDQVMQIFRSVTPIVEPLSLDEAFLDITAVAAAGGSPLAIAIDIKKRVSSETGLTVSVGLSSGKCVSKIASDLQKPDGLVVIPTEQEAEFLAPLPVGKLSGIGPKSAALIHADGVRTIGDLAQMPDSWFARRFGKRGPSIRDHSRGIDHDHVQPVRERKSISSETTFPEDLNDSQDLFAVIRRLSENVASALTDKGLLGRTVIVKMRLSDFTTFTRQTTLSNPTSDASTIESTARTLLDRELAPERAFRLLGVGISGFTDHGESNRELHLPADTPHTVGNPATPDYQYRMPLLFDGGPTQTGQ